MAIVGLAGFAGVIVFGLLYIVFLFKGASLKLPVIGMAVFALAIAAAVIVPRLELSLPTLPALPFFGGGPSQTAQIGNQGGGELPTPGADGFPQLLLNKRGLVITATGLTENGAQGPALNLSIENRSETDVTVEIRDACVNGWMVNASFSAAVAAGEKKKGSILFPASEMKRSGIDIIADLEFSFHILNRDRITFLDSDTVTIRTPAADTYQYSFDGSGKELYNENGVRIVSGGVAEGESGFGPELVLYMENATDRAITVQARDVSVNGKAADVTFSEEIPADRRSAAAVTITGVSLEEIRKISFYLRVTDRDRRTILFDTAPFTIVV